MFIAALWSPAGKGLAVLLALLYVMFYCVFVTFPCGVLGQVWYLIVSISDLASLLTFNTHTKKYMYVSNHLKAYQNYIRIIDL